MTILLVEDEVSLTSFIQKGIESEGYDLKVAFDGLMGQRLFDQQPVDVVVLDVNLPMLNGFELCRYIKQHSPRQAVMMLNEYNQHFPTPTIPRFSTHRELDLVNFAVAGALYGGLYWYWVRRRRPDTAGNEPGQELTK